ncbi:polysaccharide pyruvyl transferase family protein [Rahnella perminowiae]|uniref:polysaccharide pyruvyl transferase family protein n=1 Tax=Rahnella perminowiae TaxID=2816244 RepID=UPI00224A8898|nr:polysaccharide pyruvyl transferase family protein [Rahnella perminowiae]MCX2942935.1 polysaccharide pyruvyl transferase family protein [Rahnella perminowiae]
MKIYYYKSAHGNFGDDLNAWIWDALLPGFFDDNEDVRVSGIGTIITSAMPPAKKWYVFSSGVGYGYPPASFGDSSWETLCVRGPLSAEILGLPKDKFITDGAALLNTLAEFKPLSEAERKGVIFVPHHHALVTGQWEKVCQQAGVEFVNPQSDAKTVIQKIRNAKLVLADAMHAAIIADAMRVPWVPLITSSQINTFKWLDWTQTINLPYRPTVLGSSSLREYLRDKSLYIYGEKYFLPGSDVEFAVKYFKGQRELKNKKWWGGYQELTQLVTHRVPNKGIKTIEGLFNLDLNERFINNASNVLTHAKSQPGFLSNDIRFNSNLERLLNGMDRLSKCK